MVEFQPPWKGPPMRIKCKRYWIYVGKGGKHSGLHITMEMLEGTFHLGGRWIPYTSIRKGYLGRDLRTILGEEFNWGWLDWDKSEDSYKRTALGKKMGGVLSYVDELVGEAGTGLSAEVIREELSGPQVKYGPQILEEIETKEFSLEEVQEMLSDLTSKGLLYSRFPGP